MGLDIFIITCMLAAALVVFKRQAQARRVRFLAGYLGRYPIEQLMAQLLQTYPRAAGEADASRSQQVFAMLQPTEQRLCEQFAQFAQDMGGISSDNARAGISGFGIAALANIFPAQGFDMRKALHIHAQGLCAAATVPASPESLSQRKDRAYRMSAELLLMQHTCHWYCRGRGTADMRLIMQHQTYYEQVLNAVSPATRTAWEDLLQASDAVLS